jgi:hypothetical protein
MKGRPEALVRQKRIWIGFLILTAPLKLTFVRTRLGVVGIRDFLRKTLPPSAGKRDVAGEG